MERYLILFWNDIYSFLVRNVGSHVDLKCYLSYFFPKKFLIFRHDIRSRSKNRSKFLNIVISDKCDWRTDSFGKAVPRLKDYKEILNLVSTRDIAIFFQWKSGEFTRIVRISVKLCRIRNWLLISTPVRLTFWSLLFLDMNS